MTEVKSWNFYGLIQGQDTFSLVGSAEKIGFGTRFLSLAEAIGADVGKSPVAGTIASDKLDGQDSFNTIISIPPANQREQQEELAGTFVRKSSLAWGHLGLFS